ncbi:helix-turn-helix domain-containing protein [Paenirhodobacter populi]|uniref:helix-turn-helix domain-containing protein n=1 Tax=Paenirhodobacter populi TaxID=2306993 RepID=UPI000FE2C66F|nr:helix-turn-helix domain-containing protein [Sinirhodobacter populi]RWR09733.1 hypothetical protein D2T32_05150 [Sinirhodobacter populi]
MKTIPAKPTEDTMEITIRIGDQSFSTVIQEIERIYFSHVMTRAGGVKSQAAKLAGMPDDTFRKRIAHFKVRATYTLA